MQAACGGTEDLLGDQHEARIIVDLHRNLSVPLNKLPMVPLLHQMGIIFVGDQAIDLAAEEAED